jgi:hypothetical protein
MESIRILEMRFNFVEISKTQTSCSNVVNAPALRYNTKSITETNRNIMNRTKPSSCFVFTFRYHTLLVDNGSYCSISILNITSLSFKFGWLKSLDYLELKLLSSPTVRNNVAQFTYNDGCIKTSKHEFYGPLWIRFSLNDAHSYKKGPVKVFIEAIMLDRMMKGVPKDDARRRIALIAKKIKEIQEK